MTQNICFQFWVHISSFSLVSWRGNIGQHNRPGKWATCRSPHCPNCPSSTTLLRPNLDRSALGRNLEKSGKMKTVCTEVGVLANVFTDIFVKQNPTESYRMILDLIRCMVADLILDLIFDFMQLLIWDLMHLTLATFPPVHCWTLSLNYLCGEWSIQKSKYQ